MAPRAALRFLWPVAAFAAGVILTLATVWLRSSTPPQPLRELWSPIFEKGVKVVASYSNPSFLRVGRLPMLLIYNGPVSAPPGATIQIAPNDAYIDTRLVPKGEELHFSESWTGTGEVLAVNRLTTLSAEFQHPLSVTPSKLLGLSDMRSSNVVFIGSPSVNGALAQIGLNTRPFYSTADGRIVNRSPRSGEPAAFSNVINAVTQQTTESYALFSVVPGMDSGRTIVNSAGLNTMSTWAAIDFATSPSGAAQLIQTLRKANGNRMPRHYQAIIHTDIVKGAPSSPSLVAVRIID